MNDYPVLPQCTELAGRKARGSSIKTLFFELVLIALAIIILAGFNDPAIPR